VPTPFALKRPERQMVEQNVVDVNVIIVIFFSFNFSQNIFYSRVFSLFPVSDKQLVHFFSRFFFLSSFPKTHLHTRDKQTIKRERTNNHKSFLSFEFKTNPVITPTEKLIATTALREEQEEEEEEASPLDMC
jgi:hypothetical protein